MNGYDKLSISPCLLCGKEKSHIISSSNLISITSDCKPWDRLSDFAVCKSCGHVYKVVDNSWISDIKEIYTQYEIHPLSEGTEHVIFRDNTIISRTSLLLNFLQMEINIPNKGRLLDIGCGKGAFLRTFSKFYPQWSLFGYEKNNSFKSEILNIAGVESFFYDSLERIEGKFDIITFVHTIEHLLDPVDFIKKTKRMLVPSGNLFIQTSNFLENPFDLVVIDHCSHFHISTLIYAAELAGFKVKPKTNDWIDKEIGLVAISQQGNKSNILTNFDKDITIIVEKTLSWLSGVVEHANEIAKGSILGIFGTAIAGTWLASSLGNKAYFFIDENPSLQGKVHMGIPVLKLTEIPKDSLVYIAFPYNIAKKLEMRLKSLHPYIHFVIPPIFN